MRGDKTWFRQGAMNPRSKLTEEEVRAIRNLYDMGAHKQADLAREFSVSAATINCIIKRKRWGHLE